MHQNTVLTYPAKVGDCELVVASDENMLPPEVCFAASPWSKRNRDHQITLDEKKMEELKQKIEEANKLREMWKHVAENLDASALSYQACERLMKKLQARMDWLDDYYRENEY